MKHALVIQHLAFEDLGTLRPALLAAGFKIEMLQAGVDDLHALDAIEPELLVVLGGPIGVYEQNTYPFLSDEIGLLARRLAARRPTLGICLGAQLMAAALHAPVAPGKNGKEIGWAPISPAEHTHNSSLLAPLFDAGLKVLHWHGDSFELPHGVKHLARSEQYPNQAFAIDDFGLALQFHPEVEVAQLERWYIGHATELNCAHIAIPQLRAAGHLNGPRLERAATLLWQNWLRSLSLY